MNEFNDYNQLLKYLQNNSDAKFNEFNKRIVNSNIQTIGCTVSFMRKVAKSCSLDFILSLPVNKFVEVDLLRGIVISSVKLPFNQKTKMLTEFAENIENWAVCDCSAVKIANDEKPLYFDYFCKLLEDIVVFKCRYGVVNLLSNYIDDNHIDNIFARFGRIRLWNNYYVDMAVAWFIATAMVKCRNKTIKYMEGEGRSVLSKFAYNTALQKMRDSRQVCAEDKQRTYSLKIS